MSSSLYVDAPSISHDNPMDSRTMATPAILLRRPNPCASYPLRLALLQPVQRTDVAVLRRHYPRGCRRLPQPLPRRVVMPRLLRGRLIVMQNGAVLGATWLCCVLLRTLSDGSRHSWRGGVPTDFSSIFLLAGIHVLGSTAAVLDSGFTVAVERDWIVVMSQCAAGSSGNVEDRRRCHFHRKRRRNAALRTTKEVVVRYKCRHEAN